MQNSKLQFRFKNNCAKRSRFVYSDRRHTLFTLHSSLFTSIATSRQRGAVLFEILLAVAVIVSVVAISVQLTQVSLQSADTAGDRTVAVNLARESFEAARAVSAEKWINIYRPPDGTGDPVNSKGSSNQYHLEIQNGKWVLVAGSENVVLSGENYTRYLVVDNVSRDANTRDIEPSYNSANDDPSTQKVAVVVQKTGLPDFSYFEYLSRWKNASPVQTTWQATGQSDNQTSGDSANFNNGYLSDDGNVDTTGTPGSFKLKTQ